MRPHAARLLLLLTICGTAAAQTANPQLTISPDSGWLSSTPATVVFTAEILSPLKPLAVTLCLVNDAGTVLSNLGELRDDGMKPDAKAGDKNYSRQLQLPLDKRGLFNFMVRAEFPSPIGVRQSLVESFGVDLGTPENAEGDLWAQSFEDATYVKSITEQSGITKARLFRAGASRGPWTLIEELRYTSASRGEAIKAEMADLDPGVASHDYYYKIELYDANAVLKYAFSPVFVPAYGRPDRLLVLPAPTKQ